MPSLGFEIEQLGDFLCPGGIEISERVLQPPLVQKLDVASNRRDGNLKLLGNLRTRHTFGQQTGHVFAAAVDQKCVRYTLVHRRDRFGDGPINSSSFGCWSAAPTYSKLAVIRP